MPRRILMAMIPVLAAAALIAGCGLFGPSRPRPNIIVVLVDALRSDHLGTYGYQRDTTPRLDERFAGGAVFTDCVSQAPWTAASVAGIFTSRAPSVAGVGALADSSGRRDVMKHSCSKLPQGETTLAELLAAGGYRTAAVFTNPFASARFGMDQGFAEIVDAPLDARGVVDSALAAIGGRDFWSAETRPAPFFLYLHLMDVHSPHEPPPSFGRKFPTLDGLPHTDEHRRGGGRYHKELPPEEFAVFKSHKVALYDGSLLYVDSQIERLVRRLEDLGLMENTVIAFVADHGEGLWDHGLGMGHGFSMHREQLQVPLALFGGGVPARRVDRPVGTVDLAPTLLRLAGIDIPETMEGVDLLDDPARDRAIFSEDIAYGMERKALRLENWKLIADAEGRPLQLYDSAVDPAELRDLLAGQPERAADLAARLRGIMAANETAPREAARVDEATARQLRALGY